MSSDTIDNDFIEYARIGDFLDPDWYPFNEELTLRSHVPPQRTEAYKPRYNFISDDRRDIPTPLERILPLPPLPGKDGGEEIKIKLLSDLAFPPQYDRQHLFRGVVVSKSLPGITEDTEGLDIVAEVFDPILFDNIDADVAYISTVLSYNVLKDFQGKLIPKFYGSYTIKVPVEGFPDYKEREVRVVLREYIEGTGLNKLSPKKLTQEERKKLMENVISVYGTFDSKGISLDFGFSTGSVILTERTDIKLVVWALYAVVFSPDIQPPQLWEPHHFPGVLTSPVIVWRKDELERYGFHRFVDWPWVRWLHEKYGTELTKRELEKEQKYPGYISTLLDKVEPEGTDGYISIQSELDHKFDELVAAESKKRHAQSLEGRNPQKKKPKKARAR